MRKLNRVMAAALCGVMGSALIAPAVHAQEAQTSEDQDNYNDEEIVVTAQRSEQRLQDVPIAVSAFSAEALEEQQIENSSDLQLTLPNVTFSKGNFTGSSFTIRGIGDLCVGVSCDSATAIHTDGTPLLGTRLFETEFFDLSRIEVLRGPQGTLFGRNATSGVVNIVPARPDLNGFSTAGEIEYGNFNSIKAKGMINLSAGDKIGLRVAGFYLKRDGYTENLYDSSHIDGRDMYAIRGSLRFQPTETTTIDLMAYYFREKDDRMRIQKQMCQRDPTGVLGCLSGRRDYGIANGNSSFVGVLTSAEFLRMQGIPAAFALGSLYGADAYSTAVNPADPRVVSSDYNPTYFADEKQFQARIEQNLGKMNFQLTGFYHEASVDSSQDYSLSVQNRANYAAGLATLAAAAAGAVPGLPAGYFSPVASALIPGGPTGNLCTSLPVENNTGAFSGNKVCAATPLDFDRSNQTNKDWSVEGILSSDLDGKFNFLVGGIYVDASLDENSYYVNHFGIDYLSGVLGAFNALGRAGLAAIPGAQAPVPGFLASPFFRNNTDQLNVKSYGLFGEAYFQFNDRVKLTLGARYNNDSKYVRARSSLLTAPGFLTPFGTVEMFNSPYRYGYAVTGAPLTSRLAPYDADPATTCTINSTTTSGILTAANVSGCEDYQERRVKFAEMTGRAVLDFKITDDNLLYASYSRGYKSGGINPPLQPVFAVAEGFAPEFVDAFEIGSKNSFGNGALTLNATAFYYKYKGLQLSRIVARTSVNDNVDANIYGLEFEAVVRPSRALAINMGASYLHAEVSSDKFLSNPRDPSGGRNDAVIIKDITNGSNCAVGSTSGNVAGVNAFVNQTNTWINTIGAAGNPLNGTPGLNPGAGLQPTAAFPSDAGTTARGAFSVCAVLSSLAGPAGGSFGGIQVSQEGFAVNIKGNTLPQAPSYKWNVGVQYTGEFASGMTLVPRVDLVYVGNSYGNIFNGNVNRIEGYSQINAQLQLNGKDDRWFARAFVQNLADSNAITGLYVTDQSSGLYTNIFTLDPRRFGVAAGFKF